MQAFASNSSTRPDGSILQSTPKKSNPSRRPISRNIGVRSGTHWASNELKEGTLFRLGSGNGPCTMDQPGRADIQMPQEYLAADHGDAEFPVKAIGAREVAEFRDIER